MSNPFVPTLMRLQIPPHMAQEVSVRGHVMKADADGVIEVPKDIADELMPHGLTKAAEKPAKK